MLNSFTNLPPKLEQRLRNAVSKIVSIVEPDKIICYGVRTWTKSNWSSHASTSEVTMGSEYDLLIIPDPEKKQRRESDIIDIANHQSNLHTRLIVIVRNPDILYDTFLKGGTFFSSLCEQGIMLHDSSGIPLIPPTTYDHNAYLQHIQAQWNHYYNLSITFLDGATRYMASGNIRLAIFMMHQSTEHICTALLSVYMGYRTITHNLDRLLSLTKNISEAPASVFPRTTRQERQLFETLSRSYLEARYDDRFNEPLEKAETLRYRVKKLQEITLRLFNRRINELAATRYALAPSGQDESSIESEIEI